MAPSLSDIEIEKVLVKRNETFLGLMLIYRDDNPDTVSLCGRNFDQLLETIKLE